MAAFVFRRFSAVLVLLACGLPCAVAALADDEKPVEDNPYLPRAGLTAEELHTFIERMQQAPRTVQLQPGYTAAIEVAVDRLLASNPSDDLRAFAMSNKLQALHRSALHGAEDEQKKLMQAVKQAQDTRHNELADAVAFYLLEQRSIDASLNAKTEELPPLLAELKQFFAKQADLDRRHLRLASSTVKIINRVADDELAQRSYKEFGELWGKSQELELAKYGRRIAKGTRAKAPAIIGKPMPIVGATFDGKPFDISAYRGKPTVVVFWTTWCGPCKALMPEIKAIHEHFHGEGLEIVGISLDQDREALASYVEDESIPWPNLLDLDPNDPEKHPIAEKYGAHA